MNNYSLVQDEHFRCFFEAVAPCFPAYRHRLLSLAAIQHEGFDVILRATLRLSPWQHAAPKPPFRTPKLRASQHYLPDDPRDTEEHILSGLAQGFVLPDALAKFMPESGGRVSPWTQVRGNRADVEDPHIAQLTLRGIDVGTLFRAAPHWERELLDSEGLFHNLGEWGAHYGLKLSASEHSLIEVFAERVAWIDEERSSVDGNAAELSVHFATRIEAGLLRLRASNADPKAEPFSEIANGASLTWQPGEDGDLQAMWKFKLPEESVLRCTVVYGGCVQQELVLASPRALPNRARLMVEVTDPQLAQLRRFLKPANPETGSSRAFETAIHLLLHMLGFRSGHVSAFTHMQQEVDVFALTPAGDAILVECKTVPPDLNMLDKLWSRTQAMQSALCTRSSQFTPERVIPVLAFPNTWDEIGPAAKEYARTHNIVMLCREELDELIDRTQYAPDADAVVKTWQSRPMQRLLSGQQPI
jgi:hypothetical protein